VSIVRGAKSARRAFAQDYQEGGQILAMID